VTGQMLFDLGVAPSVSTGDAAVVAQPEPAERPEIDGPVAVGAAAAGSPRSTPSPIIVAGRRLEPTPVFDTYWRFAAARQELYQERLQGGPGPWTADPILSCHRFTNCFRAADRVSQFLIGDVSYQGSQDCDEVVFRTLMFKLFNRVETWKLLEGEFEAVSWAEFDLDRYDTVLSAALRQGRRLYSAAYLMPPPRLGAARKHTNHLHLIQMMMRNGLAETATRARSLGAVYEAMLAYPAIGPFLAFQLTIDLNYSSVIDHPESEFVVAGPGARDGIRKCFGRLADGIEHEVIRYMADHQQEHFDRLDLDFRGLKDRRPLQLIDCQNLFCEVDKYARVAHPHIEGISKRHRIKQRYRPVSASMPAWFPPKWGINEVGSRPMHLDGATGANPRPASSPRTPAGTLDVLAVGTTTGGTL